MTEGRSTILVLHPSSTDPSDFLQPTTSVSGSTNVKNGESSSSSASAGSGYTSVDIPWNIENKYYTASVNFQGYSQEIFEMSQAVGVEVVMYIFEGAVNSLPPSLVKVMANPRDIALAIRLKSSSTQNGDEREREMDRMEDLFDEIGMEYMDESSLPEDDDERPISIDERIRQTLMTHMWPNMVRKPIQSRMDMGMGFDDDIDNEDYEQEGEDGNGAEDGVSEADFPVTFKPRTQGSTTTPNNPSDPDPDLESFPGLDELRSQIMLEDLEKIQGTGNGVREGQGIDRLGFSRLDMMDDDFDIDIEGDGGDWVGAEYAKLDDWLDGDDEQPLESAVDPDEDHDMESAGNTREQRLHELNSLSIDPKEEDSQFEDDFADFAPFQSAPAPTRGSEGAEGLDPTPLLLHLQNVREELAGLDEDTRRERAGREVESVLKSLGLGGMDDLDFDDEM